MRCLLGCLGVVMLAGCGSGGGTSDVAQDLAVGHASCLVMDLDAGTVRAVSSEAAALALPGIRERFLVLVRLPAGSVAGGSAPGVRWAIADEVTGSKGSAQTFVSVFEITRGQWRRLARNQPWATMPAGLVGSGDALPACGLSLELAQAGVTIANARLPGRFSLPSADQREYVCRGGATGRFPWGDSQDPAVAGLYAVTADTATALAGPRQVGSQAPNAFGLYDTVGNVWELASDGTIHGGSWLDGLPMARSANRMAIDPTSAHALVGVRLLYSPGQP